eukprot:m.59382 g.59382  ORF g.59382 m.59382 type:complete len:324 (-) comp19099_c0_seq1:25-996(-)
MIFVDPPEDPVNIPSPSDSSVLYFPPGYHDLKGNLQLNDSIQHVYLAPGSYVMGGITSQADHAVNITGRGIFAGSEFPFHDPRFPWALVLLPSSSGHFIEGITIVDPPKYYFRTYATNVYIYNVKLCVAWTYNTDGIVGGAHTLVDRSFIRSNDDSLKIYSDGMTIRNTVVWQLQNGGTLQTGWWAECNRTNILVENLDVIHAEWLAEHHFSQNNGVIDNAKGDTSRYYMVNNTFRNIRVEEPNLYSFMNVQLNPNATGTVAHWRIENVTTFSLTKANFLMGAPQIEIQNFTFANFQLNHQCIQSAAQGNFSLKFAKDVNFLC